MKSTWWQHQKFCKLPKMTKFQVERIPHYVVNIQILSKNYEAFSFKTITIQYKNNLDEIFTTTHGRSKRRNCRLILNTNLVGPFRLSAGSSLDTQEHNSYSIYWKFSQPFLLHMLNINGKSTVPPFHYSLLIPM